MRIALDDCIVVVDEIFDEAVSDVGDFGEEDDGKICAAKTEI